MIRSVKTCLRILGVVMAAAVAAPGWCSSPNADFELLTRWFAGEFNNFEQVVEEEYREEEDGHQHVHSVFAPVEVPGATGRHFYVQQTLVGEMSKVYRQRLYSFEPDTDESSIVMRISKLSDEAAALNAHMDPASLEALGRQDFEEIEGCEVVWQRRGRVFEGRSREGSCRVVSGDRELVFRDEVRLEENAIHIKEWATDGEGRTVFGGEEEVPSMQRRCRYYTGWVVFRPEGTDDEPSIMRGLRLHDQGQRIAVVDREGQATDFVVELASVTYEKGSVAVLKLALYQVTEDGDDRILYTWNEQGAERIGFNLGWAQAGFTAEDAAASPKIVMLRDWMSGAFSSRAQNEEDPENFHDIRLHMAPMWTDRNDALWLYVEQAVASHLEKPYRQRVYRLTQLDDELFESKVYTFEEPLEKAGAWRDAEPLADLEPTDLTARDGCSIILRWTGTGFEGSTLGRLCKSSLHGATFATSEVVITPERVVSWDRGFDDAGRHIWGAEKSGYVFDSEVEAGE